MSQVRRLFLPAFLLLATVASAQEAAQRPLTLEDYGSWSRIVEVHLSADGLWLAYTLQPNEGDATSYVRQLEGSALYQAVNGQTMAFSSDGRWVGLLASPPKEEADRLRKERRSGEGRERTRRSGSGGGGGSDPAPRLQDAGEAWSPPKTLHLVDLDAGTRTEEPGVRSFTFSESGAYLAIHRDPSDVDAEHGGSDLLLRDLSRGTVLSLGNVSEYAFDETGEHIAYLVDAHGQAGNGLYVVSPGDGRIRPLDTGSYHYEDLAWNDTGSALAALRGTEVGGALHRQNDLVVTSDVGGSALTTLYAPSEDPSFPTGFVLSEMADTRWTDNGEHIVLGIKQQEDDPDPESPDGSEDEDAAEDQEERVNVDVWHWSDDRIQSTQIVQAQRDLRYTYTSVYNVEAARFVRLATDDMRTIEVTEGPWAIGRRDVAYRSTLTEAGGRADYVRLNLATGKGEVIAESVRRPLGTSPNGAWWVYLSDERVQAVELATLERGDLSERVGVEFVNREFDRINEAPAYGLAGWTEDGAVVLNTRWDVWSVPLTGGAATNLTGGAGEQSDIRYRVVELDPDADYLDPDQAVLSSYGEWTKQSGYVRARPGRSPELLLVEDEMIGDLIKAADTDRVVFTRQTFETFPDYWVAETDFRDPRRVTDSNPQIAEFAWGRRVLIDYTDERGNELQATLALPAGYEEGTRYPMIVYFYEKMSQRHHQFSMPVYDDRPHMSTYASNGYLVLMPDIVYDDGYPGSSALDDVTSATTKVVDLGYADPDRVGLQGHSWGGYETSFILTQTNMFRTIVTGAPLTNLMSMNNILYKRTGNQNGPILEWSQGRMGDQPWDDMERWMSQSPVHHAPNIETPFLILHGTEDGAVDWNQGLELYTAARRLGKEVILLSYPGEPHHLRRKANQKDFQIRMKEFFDHHLLDVPAPEWIQNGVPYLEKAKEKKPRTVS